MTPGKHENPFTDQNGRRKFFRRGQRGEIRWLVHAERDGFAYPNGVDPLEPWEDVDAASDDDWREITDEGELREIEARLG